MKLTVIVPSYNGAKKLPYLLKSLQNQSYRDFELLVYLDGSTDNSKAVLEELSGQFTCLNVFAMGNGGRAVARNTAASLARGELLLFIDDDMRMEPNAIEEHLKHHQKHPNTLFFGNQIDDETQADTEVKKWRLDASRRWFGGIKTVEGRMQEPFLTAAHFSVPKQLFFELGGFDKRLRDIEDMALAIVAFDKKVPIYFDPKILGWHNDPITCAKFIKRQREYSQWIGEFQKYYPQDKRYTHYFDSPKNPIKKFLFWFFGSSFWVKQIDNHGFFMKLLPKKIRYRFYELVIWALGKEYRDRPLPL